MRQRNIIMTRKGFHTCHYHVGTGGERKSVFNFDGRVFATDLLLCFRKPEEHKEKILGRC